MSLLVVDLLKDDPLIQNFTLLRRSYFLNFKPYLYFHNMPSGTFKMEIKQGVKIFRSFHFTADEARAAFGGSKPYFHVRLALHEAPFFLEAGDYSIELSAIDYEYTPAAFMAWVKSLFPFGKVTGDDPRFYFNPFHYTMAEMKDRVI